MSDEVRYPAPWRLDAYFAPQTGRYVWRVLAANHEPVLNDCPEDIARRVVECREESGSDTDAIASVQARWQAALDAAHAETERVRAHFLKEIATYEAARAAAALTPGSAWRGTRA